MYQSYLLRLWQDNPHGPWHASVQSVQTSQILHFADLDALVAFLWGQTAPHPDSRSLSLSQGTGEEVIGGTGDVVSAVMPQSS